MAAEQSYARLGFFVVVGVIVMLATGLFFIQRLRSQEVITLVTYFTENVSGLDISSPVRFRGVSVGRVSNIRIDPNGGTIEVDFEVFKDRITTVGASVKRVEELADLTMFPNTRASVVGNLVSGDAYLLLDNPSDAPPPIALPFTPSRAYVPSMPSVSASVQDRLPAVLERAQETLQTLREMVARVPASLDRSDQFFTNVEGMIRESQLPELISALRSFSTSSTAQFAQISSNIAQVSSNIAQISSNMDRIAGTDGTLVKFAEEARSAIRAADVSASSQAARDAADRTSLAADDLRRSLPAIRDTLAELRELARRLDEQPESLVYGPRQPEATSR